MRFFVYMNKILKIWRHFSLASNIFVKHKKIHKTQTNFETQAFFEIVNKFWKRGHFLKFQKLFEIFEQKDTWK